MILKKRPPGPLVRTTDEIIKEIKQADTIMERYRKEFEIFENNYNVLEDGNASKRVVERVFLNKRNSACTAGMIPKAAGI